MSPFTHDLPTTQIVDKLSDLAPAGLTHLRSTAEPVVELVSDALGRSSRPRWPWIVAGLVGALAVVVVVSRRRSAAGDAIEEQPVRLAS